MFLLLPLPERSHWLPVVTTGLVGLNVLLFLVLWPRECARTALVSREEWQVLGNELVQIASSPGAELPEPLADRLRSVKDLQPAPSPQLVKALEAIQTEAMSLSGEARYQWDERYARFEAMTRSIAAAREGETPYRRWGFRPDRPWFPTILTHQFLHAGWMHIVFNMLFLSVAGTVLEPRVGFHFLWIYLTGGVAAAACQAAWNPLNGDLMVTVRLSGALPPAVARDHVRSYSLLAPKSPLIRQFGPSLTRGIVK
jgi:hypothetical protein